jgi:energy-coupling factor transporter ATP-binding protein EcfA2
MVRVAAFAHRESDGLVEETDGAAGGALDMITVKRDLTGTLVVGEHNVVIDAERGSIVTVVTEADRPDPIRRGRVELRPRRRDKPPLGADTVIQVLGDAVQSRRSAQLWGPSGAGKSTLLRHAAWVIEPGPDGVLFLSAAGREPLDLAQEVFEACYEAPGYAPSRADLKHRMTGIRVTVYVDDADYSGDQLRDLMDEAPDATFVFASSADTLRGEGSVVEVRGLGLEDGLALLDQELDSPLAAEERTAAAGLWRAADGRPVLLLRAAGLIRSCRPRTVALPRPQDLLPLLFSRLSEVEVRVLWLLTTLQAAPVDPVHIGALAEVPDAAVLCGRLERAGVLLGGEQGYRCALDVPALVLKRYPKPFPPDLICRYLVRWAVAPETTPAQLASQALVLAQAVSIATDTGQPALAVQLARAVSPRMAWSLRFGSWGLLLGRGWRAARASGDKSAEAYFTHEEGIRSLLTGHRVIAGLLAAEALVLWRELGDIHAIKAAEIAARLSSVPAHVPPYPAVQLPAGPSASGLPGASGHAASGGGPAGAHASAMHAGAAVTQTSIQSPITQGPQIAVSNGGSASHTVLHHMATCAHVPVQHFAVIQPLNPIVPSAIGGSHSIPLIGKLVATFTTKGASFVALVVTVAVVGSAAVVAGAVFLVQHAATQTGMAGTWVNSQLGDVTFTQTGSDTYSAQGTQCPGVNLTLSGTGPTYSGSVSMIPDSGNSCTVIGYTTDTWAISPGGQTAVFTRTMPSGEQGSDGERLTCPTCGTYTFTRVPQP